MPLKYTERDFEVSGKEYTVQLSHEDRIVIEVLGTNDETIVAELEIQATGSSRAEVSVINGGIVLYT